MSYTIKLDALGQFKITQGSDKRYITIEDSDRTITDHEFQTLDLTSNTTYSFDVADTSAGYLIAQADVKFGIGIVSTSANHIQCQADGWAIMAFTNATTFYMRNNASTNGQGQFGFWLT
jgi:hypothetical protein